MVFIKLAALIWTLCLATGIHANPRLTERRQTQPFQTDPEKKYDVVIVGGGPAGLSALSGLVRVRRKVLLIDSGEYRNGQTRYNHDILGFDGVPPALFRAKAREQISRYPTAFFQNETVTSIVTNDGDNSFITTVSSGETYNSRKIVLATGIVDILPDTPGIKEAWARGMFWCPWCDSWEHRDQPAGILGDLSESIGTTLSITTLNKDIILFTNGTDTPTNRAILDKKRPGWDKSIEKHGIRLENRTILSIDRLQNGGELRNETTWNEYDLFQVNLEDGTKVQRASFLAEFPLRQRSYLGRNIGVKLDKNDRIEVVPLTMRAAKGVWGIGDANNDMATNVPHAMFTGKKAAVFAHMEIIRDDTATLLSKRSEPELLENMGRDLENLWESLKKTR